MSVKARGGVAVVQEPHSATAPGMPQSAIERVTVDHVVHPPELPGLLVKLTAEQASAPPPPPGEAVDALEGTKPGDRAELVCPACHGVLTEAAVGEFRHFRCHVGHAFSLESLIGEQSEDVERALWAAVRSLEEGAALSGRLSSQPGGELRRRFAEKKETLMRQADVIRRILLHGEPRLEAASEAQEQEQ
jgi:two-component system chemotaxis response regulator CheB